jgi:hypothetical protein
VIGRYGRFLAGVIPVAKLIIKQGKRVVYLQPLLEMFYENFLFAFSFSSK